MGSHRSWRKTELSADERGCWFDAEWSDLPAIDIGSKLRLLGTSCG
jgi:hypothetical protein